MLDNYLECTFSSNFLFVIRFSVTRLQKNFHFSFFLKTQMPCYCISSCYNSASGQNFIHLQNDSYSWFCCLLLCNLVLSSILYLLFTGSIISKWVFDEIDNILLLFLAMAGNIIPAIATTNAIISGVIVMQALNILNGKLDKCKTVSSFVQLFNYSIF